MKTWTTPLIGLGLGMLIGLVGVAIAEFAQDNVAEEAQHASELIGRDLHLAKDQLRRFEERWQAQTHLPLPEPLLPPPPSIPLNSQQFRERLAQSLALNGLHNGFLNGEPSLELSESSTQDIHLNVSTRIDALLALVVQMDEAAPDARLKAWSIRCEDLLCQAPLKCQLTWQLQRSTDAKDRMHAFMDVASSDSASLQNPFEVADWWQRQVDQAPMAKGSSRRQWQKDMQAAQSAKLDHQGPGVWLGWVGRREGRRALVQFGDETLSVKVGQAVSVSREPMVIEAMDAQALHLRRWVLNERGRWQVDHATQTWVKPE